MFDNAARVAVAAPPDWNSSVVMPGGAGSKQSNTGGCDQLIRTTAQLARSSRSSMTVLCDGAG